MTDDRYEMIMEALEDTSAALARAARLALHPAIDAEARVVLHDIVFALREHVWDGWQAVRTLHAAVKDTEAKGDK